MWFRYTKTKFLYANNTFLIKFHEDVKDINENNNYNVLKEAMQSFLLKIFIYILERMKASELLPIIRLSF